MMKTQTQFVLLFLTLVACNQAAADWFGTGENCFEIPFVAIGDPGAPADTTGAPNPAGGVGYTYWMGKYEVPEEVIRKANAQSALDSDPLAITLDERGPQKPATSLSWYEAARFVNWLNEDTGHAPAYKFDSTGAFQLWQPSDPGYNPANAFRNSLAVYVLPSVDEWYKAAFYDLVVDVWWDYPTGSNDPPIPVESGNDPGTAVWNQVTGPADVQMAGGESPYGTVAQGGNVYEWQEGPISGVVETPMPDVRAFRSARWGLTISPLGLSASSLGERLSSFSGEELGFRIARVPEPESALSVAAATLCLAYRRPY